ncbi:BCCT family transporter [Fusibacter ferrireducens]|uniref:BCCT family transporter n=1 Tax=Fusibacter ferrireducens TaxID=2785058 RepID=A0ABR9ZPJ8_9FIRM|nr:BCCT family transporter [Fusibacter ferrireducens]MBF4692387.1 BCCT family transporter [Fusibacter ferrireducens]
MSQKLKTVAEEKLFSRNFTKYGLDLNPAVSIGAGLIIILFALFAFVDLDRANTVFGIINTVIVSNFDWLFVLSSNFFILVSLIMAFSKLGSVKIGGVDAQPEFSNFSWYSMLMSAGMGIGLMFWSVGEPLYHLMQKPPIFNSNMGDTQAMATTFFHWGLHPWGIYALISLSLAFFAYNKKLPLSLRSVFYPLLKDKIFGFWGDMIDILAVVSCLFGLATSLGLGVQQINSGLNYLFGIHVSVMTQVLLIVGITGLATISVVTGLDKGVKILSELNIKLAGLFLAVIFVLGPTGYLVKLFSNSLGLYMNNFINASFFVSTDGSTWQASWSVFYLAWWISWSPFVGMFIARISKGRTVREFVLAVLIVPSLLSFIWLTVFGGTAMHINGLTSGALFETVGNNLPVAIFEMIQNLNVPLLEGAIKTGLSLAGTVLVISFFVTSSDSGSLVVDNITSGGKLNSPVTQRVFWASMEGLVAIVLLLIGGETALKALQTAVIATGLPFAIILIIMSFLLLRSVQKAYKRQKYIKDLDHFETMMEEYEDQAVEDQVTA